MTPTHAPALLSAARSRPLNAAGPSSPSALETSAPPGTQRHAAPAPAAAPAGTAPPSSGQPRHHGDHRRVAGRAVQRRPRHRPRRTARHRPRPAQGRGRHCAPSSGRAWPMVWTCSPRCASAPVSGCRSRRTRCAPAVAGSSSTSPPRRERRYAAGRASWGGRSTPEPGAGTWSRPAARSAAGRTRSFTTHPRPPSLRGSVTCSPPSRYRPPMPVSTLATHMRKTSAYVATAVAGELEKVQSAREGGRNRALYFAAYALARFIRLGDLTEAGGRRRPHRRRAVRGPHCGRVPHRDPLRLPPRRCRRRGRCRHEHTACGQLDLWAGFEALDAQQTAAPRWEEPIPLTARRDLPAFPTDVFPAWLGRLRGGGRRGDADTGGPRRLASPSRSSPPLPAAAPWSTSGAAGASPSTSSSSIALPPGNRKSRRIRPDDRPALHVRSDCWPQPRPAPSSKPRSRPTSPRRPRTSAAAKAASAGRGQA